jgi:hypothetical protein
MPQPRCDSLRRLASDQASFFSESHSLAKVTQGLSTRSQALLLARGRHQMPSRELRLALRAAVATPLHPYTRE